MLKKRRNFTKTNIVEMCRITGYGYGYIGENGLRIQTKKDKHTTLEIDSVNDWVILNSKEVYKSNQDKELFDVFPNDEAREDYGENFNPFCNIYYLFKHIEKLEEK